MIDTTGSLGIRPRNSFSLLLPVDFFLKSIAFKTEYVLFLFLFCQKVLLLTRAEILNMTHTLRDSWRCCYDDVTMRDDFYEELTDDNERQKGDETTTRQTRIQVLHQRWWRRRTQINSRHSQRSIWLQLIYFSFLLLIKSLSWRRHSFSRSEVMMMYLFAPWLFRLQDASSRLSLSLSAKGSPSRLLKNLLNSSSPLFSIISVWVPLFSSTHFSQSFCTQIINSQRRSVTHMCSLGFCLEIHACKSGLRFPEHLSWTKRVLCWEFCWSASCFICWRLPIFKDS